MTRLALSLLLLAISAFPQEQLPYASLAQYLAKVKSAIPRAKTNAFVELPAADRAAFTKCMRSLLEGDVPAAAACLAGVNYSLGSLDGYLIARERSEGSKGLGTYIVNPKWIRNFVLEAPHPLYDAGTAEEGLAILEKAGARALFISGVHRCSNIDTPSGCTGSTSACGSDMPFRISDAGHFDRNFFTAAHRATLHLAPQPVAVSLHGNASEPVDAEISDGTANPAAGGSLVIRLRKALEARGANAGSCNWPADRPGRLKLCGGTNVQGRLSNASKHACAEAAERASGFFIHIEQRKSLRDDPAPLIEALRDVLPSTAK